MSAMGTVSSSLTEKLLVDFVSQISSTGTMMGSFDTTERLLLSFLPQDRVATIMEEIRGPAGRNRCASWLTKAENGVLSVIRTVAGSTTSVFAMLL